MDRSAKVEIVDIADAASFELVPPCSDARFDHRTCDYWEDEVHGSKAARPSRLTSPAAPPRPKRQPSPDNPFAPPARDEGPNPFAPPAREDAAESNPFAPQSQVERGPLQPGAPPKLRWLDRGRAIFGSYAKVLLVDGEPAVYAQFGPLSAYPRAQHIRDLYPSLPSSPLPAVITCVASTAAARGRGFAKRIVRAVLEDLAERGFAAVEAYPDLTLGLDEASAATPGFWEACGFELAVPDERYPVMRRVLG